MTLVIDASVAVKWYVPEPNSSEAALLLAGGMDLVAPDLLVAEFANVIWKKARAGELTHLEGSAVVQAFVDAPPLSFRSSRVFLPAAFQIATEYRRTVYDALYLAVAVAEDAVFVTADEKLVHALRGTRMEAFCRSLPVLVSELGPPGTPSPGA